VDRRHGHWLRCARGCRPAVVELWGRASEGVLDAGRVEAGHHVHLIPNIEVGLINHVIAIGCCQKAAKH
jgi:hypothetical protein